MLTGDGFKVDVLDTVVRSRGLRVHKAKILEGTLRTGDSVRACVNTERLKAIRRNHTATHLLHESLVRILGGHVRQSGSLVGESGLRFDFTHFEPLSREQVIRVEHEVNSLILANNPLDISETDMENARAAGAKALFEEKYGDVVRVVKISDFSAELCGGLHVGFTGEIGLFKILREEGIGSGTRRITGVTGVEAMKVFQRTWRTLGELSGILAVDEAGVPAKVEHLQTEVKSLGRTIEEMKINSLSSALESSLKRTSAKGVEVVFGRFDAVGAEMLRELGDRVKNRPAPEGTLVLLASVDGENVTIIAMADEKALARGVSAGRVVKEGSAMLGGGGGGRPALAQGGGRKPEALEELFQALPGLVERQIS
jgi:alanyl-tRNA synthetase